MLRSKSTMKSKSTYTSKQRKAKSRLRLQASSTKCKYWPSPRAGRPLPPLTKAKSCKLLPLKSKKLLPTVVTVSSSGKAKAKHMGKGKTNVTVKHSKGKPKKQRRSPLMRRALKPLMPSSRLPREGISSIRSRPLRKSQSPVIRQNAAKLVDAAGKGKNRGTPVLFLVKDSTKYEPYTESVGNFRKSKNLQKPQSSFPRSRSRTLSLSLSRPRSGAQRAQARVRAQAEADALADFNQTDRRMADNRYMKAIKSLSNPRRPAIGGVEFFYNLGQRVAPTKQRSRLHMQQRLAGGGIGGGQLKDVEVPLTSRLPIIDFISTTEFQSMYAPQAKRAARRSLL